nr:hypothetical protein CFP56_28518 [Quercus suber]
MIIDNLATKRKPGTEIQTVPYNRDEDKSSNSRLCLQYHNCDWPEPKKSRLRSEMATGIQHDLSRLDVQPSTFPAPSKSTSSITASASTTVSVISFTDRLLVTISQSGTLSHWIHVPLSSVSADPMNPSFTSAGGDTENSLLPRTELTATTVFGGTKREDEVMGQTLSTTIASAILVKRPGEQRLLVVGLGLGEMGSMGRHEFEEVLGLVLDCL